MLPLVDYASSSDDEARQVDGEEETVADTNNQLDSAPPASAPAPLPQKRAAAPAKEETIARPAVIPSVEKLPDASLLLNSPTASSTLSSAGDHASRVAAAMADSASRKRESNAPSSSATRSKVPRGALPHAKGLPDTGGGLLIPPQLKGRSNVVTEDISKLFVKRQTDPST